MLKEPDRHSSVDPFFLTILRPRVQIPTSAIFMIFSICERTKIKQKEAGIGPLIFLTTYLKGSFVTILCALYLESTFSWVTMSKVEFCTQSLAWIYL